MSLLVRFFGVTALAAFVCALLRRSSLAALVDLEMLACVCVGALGAMLVGATQFEWASAWSFVVRGGGLDESQQRAAAHWFHLGRRSILASGGVTYCVGLIWLLSNLNSPVMLGWGVGASLLSIVYALSISELVFYPFAIAAGKSLDPPVLERRALLSAVIVVALVTAPIAVLMAVL